MKEKRTDIAFTWTDENVAELRRLWNKGLSTIQIGEALGCGKNAVIGKSRRIGLDSRKDAISDLTVRGRAEKQKAMNAESDVALLEALRELPSTHATDKHINDLTTWGKTRIKSTLARLETAGAIRIWISHDGRHVEVLNGSAPAAPQPAPTPQPAPKPKATPKPTPAQEQAIKRSRSIGSTKGAERAQAAVRLRKLISETRTHSQARKSTPPLIRFQTCQWIEGEPTADDSCKCGAPVSEGAYCAHHMARACRATDEPIMQAAE